MVGTAFPAARVFLVEQPGGWGPAGLLESDFDAELATELVQRLQERGVRVLAIRRPGRTARPARRRWAFVDTRPGRRRQVWAGFDQDAELIDLLDAGPAILDEHANRDRPTYLICAHGRHDVCCAIEGRPVAAALAALRPDDVWESSHLGGDRFAANVLVLPSGVQYGRVPPAGAAQLVNASDQGQVMTDWLRGIVGYPGAAQAALAHLYAQAQSAASADESDAASADEQGENRIGPDVDSLRLVGFQPGRVGGTPARIRIDTREGPVDVGVEIGRSAPELLTCSARRPGVAWRYSVRFVDDSQTLPAADRS